MYYLLCTDLHLDDQKANEYRWRVFDEMARAWGTYADVSCVYCLGDAIDRRDRHSAELVNRFVSAWQGLPIPRRVILRGNHDTTISGASFWEFMSGFDGIEYVSRPTAHGDLLLLPYSPNPKAEWNGLRFRDYRAIFLHATVTGAIAENGFSLRGQDVPLLPRSAKIYSGDVHNAQTVRNVTYVGAPHPVKFGDSYPTRFLLLDEESYDVVEEIPVRTIGKRAVEISTLADLASVEVEPGDQVRVTASVSPDALDWAGLEAGIETWARERGVSVSTIEGTYEVSTQSGTADLDAAPDVLLRAFAAEEGVTVDLLDVGLDLLREARG